MKKKLRTCLMALVLSVACALTLIACDEEDDHKHSFSTQWSYDETYHWHAATCEHTGEIKDNAEHTIIEGECTVCDYVVVSPDDGDDTPTTPENPGDGDDTPSTPEEPDDGDDTPTTPEETDDGEDTPSTPEEPGDGDDTPTTPENPDDGDDTPTTPEEPDDGDDTPTTPEEPAPHVHTFAETFSKDATHHWYEATCEHTEEVSGRAEHTWNDGEITTPATCTDDGVKTYTCTDCGQTKTAVVELIDHAYSETWSVDETHHWHEVACGCALDIKDYGAHDFGTDNKCDGCGYLIESQGLEFTLSSDETYYIVSGMGTCRNTDIVIPAVYNTKEVKEIGDDAFSYCDSLTSVTIGESVTSIGYHAFSYCDSLTSVTFKNTTGWKVGSTSLNSYDLSNTSTAARYLKSTYYISTWTRGN